MKLILYLKKRNKRGIITIAILEGNISKPTKINNLNLHTDLKSRINSIIEENKLNYEVWIEPFTDSSSFVNSLRNQGMKNIPMKLTPLIRKFDLPKISFKIQE